MNILLIAGGWSSERDVSLAGGKMVRKALQALGHSVTAFDPALSLDGLTEAVDGKDFAFINLHGAPGEDGLIQAMLERLDCAYQGAGPAASILALNKAAAKVLFTNEGLDTPPWQLITERPEKEWQPMLGYPLFIKANTGGSSLHMEKIVKPAELAPALERLFSVNAAYIVERAVAGMEVTCAVLGRLDDDREIAEPMPPILIKPCGGSPVFDYTSKYSPGGAEELCPAPISEQLTAKIQSMALSAHHALGISGYSRSDFIVPDDPDAADFEQPRLLEVNTLPGMTPHSLLPKAATAHGLTFEMLVERLIDLGVARHARATPTRA